MWNVFWINLSIKFSRKIWKNFSILVHVHRTPRSSCYLWMSKTQKLGRWEAVFFCGQVCVIICYLLAVFLMNKYSLLSAPFLDETSLRATFLSCCCCAVFPSWFKIYGAQAPVKRGEEPSPFKSFVVKLEKLSAALYCQHCYEGDHLGKTNWAGYLAKSFMQLLQKLRGQPWWILWNAFPYSNIRNLWIPSTLQ